MMPIVFKCHIRREDRAPLVNFLGTSQVWMRTAIHVFGERPNRQVDELEAYELNVADVCAAYAFELVLKALAMSEGQAFRPSHAFESNYLAVSKRSQARMAEIVIRHTPYTINEFIQEMDKRVSDPDRKYWMVGPRGEQRPVGLGLAVIPGFAEVHRELVDSVGFNAFANWQSGMHVHLLTGPFDPIPFLSWTA